MSASEDIRNLFGKFEGQAQQYHEVSREDQATQARTRWPLISSVDLGEPDRVPAVGAAGTAVASGAASPAASATASASATSTPSSTSAAGVRSMSGSLRQDAPAFRVKSGPAPGAGLEATTDYPPVVTPETSTRHVLHARDFAPAIVPVNHFSPSSLPTSPSAREPRGDALPAPRASLFGHAAAVGSEPSLTAIGNEPPTSQFESPASRPTSPLQLPAEQPPSSSGPQVARPRSSILGRMFAPVDTVQSSSPSERDEPAAPGSRDLRAVFNRLAGAGDRKRDS